jgi:hypothetical protein
VEDTQRIGGAALIAAAGGTVLAMAHHPVGAHSGALGPAVHAAMIAFLALTAFGFAAFAAARGPARPKILAGIILYALALFGHVGAATINGFVVPALAGRGPGAVDHDIFLLAWEANQALAKLGVIASSLAFLFWSLDFLGRSGVEARAIGMVGLAAGILPPALLLAGMIDMDVAGAFLAYAAQAAWGVCVGLHLVRRRAAPA